MLERSEEIGGVGHLVERGAVAVVLALVGGRLATGARVGQVCVRAAPAEESGHRGLALGARVVQRSLTPQASRCVQLKAQPNEKK